MTPENEWIEAWEAGLRAQIIRGSNGRGPAVLLFPDAAGIRPSILATAGRLVRSARRHSGRFFMADATSGKINFGPALVKTVFLARRLTSDAVALAVALSGRAGKGRLACIVSGGNIDLSKLTKILGEH